MNDCTHIVLHYTGFVVPNGDDNDILHAAERLDRGFDLAGDNSVTVGFEDFGFDVLAFFTSLVPCAVPKSSESHWTYRPWPCCLPGVMIDGTGTGEGRWPL